MSLPDVLARIDSDLDAGNRRRWQLLRSPLFLNRTPRSRMTGDRAAGDWLVEDLNSFGIETTNAPPRYPMGRGGHVDGPADKRVSCSMATMCSTRVIRLTVDRDPFVLPLKTQQRPRDRGAGGAADDKGQLMTLSRHARC